MRYKGKVEYGQARRLRARNKRHYRLSHWPIWVAVFFLAPGSSTFALFDHGLGWANRAWLLAVMVGTGIAAFRGLIPGTEGRPYILRFDEDRPNPVYRRICYTFAWNAALSFAILNMCGLVVATATGQGYMKELYRYVYPPLCCTILLLGAAGVLPRTGPSTKREGLERRYFYGLVWAVTLAQVMLLAVWKMQLPTELANPVKLLVFAGTLLVAAFAAYRGLLPRTRPILPGKLVMAD